MNRLTRYYSFLLAVVLAIFLVTPFGYILALSLTDSWVFPNILPQTFTGYYWQEVLSGSIQIADSFVLSAWLSLAVALFSTMAGFVTGKFIAYHSKREQFLFLAYVPFIMSPVILGTCLMYLYIKASLVGSTLGVIVAQTMFGYGFSIVFFSAYWNESLQEMENLVYTLGGSVWQAYRRVLLPLSKGVLLLCFFQTFLISWFQYGLTLLIGAGKVQTLPIKVYDYINEANIYYAALASCLLVLPPIFLLWLNRKIVFQQQR